jgi:hypothetical protein
LLLVHVLELIDAEMGKAPPPQRRRLRVGLDERGRQRHQIIEVDPVLCRRDLAAGGDGGRNVGVVGFASRALHQRNGFQKPRRPALRHAKRRGERAAPFWFVSDAEVRLEAGSRAALAQDRKAERMEAVDRASPGPG